LTKPNEDYLNNWISANEDRQQIACATGQNGTATTAHNLTNRYNTVSKHFNAMALDI
jgi:hypothetical protein